MFDLSFEGPGNSCDEEGCWGKIIINHFDEMFFSNTSFFDEKSYRKQWCHAVDVLFRKKKSYFLVNVYKPDVANFFVSWPCYLCGDSIFLQNKILFADHYPLDKVISLKVDLEDLEFVDEDNQKISTWQTDIKSMIDFKDKTQAFLC